MSALKYSPFFALFMFCFCKKKNDISVQVPLVTINNITKERTYNNANMRFNVSLNKPASSSISLSYETIANTAIANVDFKPISNKITFNIGEQEKTIDIEIIGDSLRKPNQTFYVQLSNPSNCVIDNDKGTGIIINENNTYLPTDNIGYIAPTSYAGYNLAWSDEFNGNSINTNYWTHETGNNNGWGNNELEVYTADSKNSFVSAGNLVIEARQQDIQNYRYSSARMSSKDKKSFQFGRIDIRAKLPIGQGIWPALWMLGSNIGSVNWPACGEIDIMEYLGHEPNKIYATLHWGENFQNHIYNGSNYVLSTGKFNEQFHVYSLLWKQDSVKVLVDNIEFYTINKNAFTTNYPFNAPFFFIFNIAVGGNWPGSPNSTTTLPQRMYIDYVRVYQ